MNYNFVKSSFLFLFLIIVLIPDDVIAHEHFNEFTCNGVILEKKSNKNLICVFEESVLKLLDRGYAIPATDYVRYLTNETQVRSCAFYIEEEHRYFKYDHEGWNNEPCYRDIRADWDICSDYGVSYHECYWMPINYP